MRCSTSNSGEDKGTNKANNPASDNSIHEGTSLHSNNNNKSDSQGQRKKIKKDFADLFPIGGKFMDYVIEKQCGNIAILDRIKSNMDNYLAKVTFCLLLRI